MKARFAIIGAGTAGLALAAMLAKQDFHVTIFEKAPSLDPVGAGLLLQPAGLAVFEYLGILEHAISLGAKVTGLEGQLSNGHLIVDSHYRQADPHFYGIGIHRSSLCHILKQTLVGFNNVEWRMSHDVQQLIPTYQHVKVHGQYDEYPFEETFDMAIIANGARSHLRPKQWVRLDKPYPWGAAWSIVPECNILDSEILHQFYRSSNTMMGVLPTGQLAQTTQNQQQRLSSIFWSLPTHNIEHFIDSSKETWLNYIHQFWPDIAHWLQQCLNDTQYPMQWLSAHYRDVVMSQYGEQRIGVIGDAAHAMSPQLGQGANMALLDAWALHQSIQIAYQQKQPDYILLWQHYHVLRKSSIHMYQSFSRLLTPLYQSNLFATGSFRNITFSCMNQIPYFKKQMAITISGLKTGLFTHLKYQDIARQP